MKESRKEGSFTGIGMPEGTTGVCSVSGGEKNPAGQARTDSDGLKELAALISK